MIQRKRVAEKALESAKGGSSQIDATMNLPDSVTVRHAGSVGSSREKFVNGFVRRVGVWPVASEAHVSEGSVRQALVPAEQFVSP